jgi:hypothetical protein
MMMITPDQFQLLHNTTLGRRLPVNYHSNINTLEMILLTDKGESTGDRYLGCGQALPMLAGAGVSKSEV